MKTISLTVILLILLLSNVAFATTVYTDYQGSGDFEIQTTISSLITPSITDSATIHTGCDGGCCCCPDCAGDYEGNQIVTNNPFSASGHKASVTDGCISIEQRYTDKLDSQTVETLYYTYFNGTGTAESYVYVIPGSGMSYQLASGIGSAFTAFNQVVLLNDDFDYGTNYGGGVLICSPGYAELSNNYYFFNGQIFYNTQMGLYCYPVDESSLYAFLFAKTTDYFGFSSALTTDFIGTYQDIEVIGFSDYGLTVNSTDNIDFVFDMELG